MDCAVQFDYELYEGYVTKVLEHTNIKLVIQLKNKKTQMQSKIFT